MLDGKAWSVPRRSTAFTAEDKLRRYQLPRKRASDCPLQRSAYPQISPTRLLNRNSRRSCGNVGIAAAISKGGGKGGKPAFGFPGFPRPGISTAACHLIFAPFFCFSAVRRNRYDSVPVSRM